MSGKPGGNRGLRRAAALAVVAAVAVLTACGGSRSSSGGSASAGSATYRAELAYAHCMQTHDVPGFPDPNPSGSFGISVSGQPHANSPAARANDACEHLLPAGSTGTGSATAPAAASPPGAAAADCPGSLPCYTPRQLRVAYGIQPLLDRGIDGRGVTVALPEEAESGRPGPSRSPASCRRSPASGRTWRTSTAGSDCPPHGSRSSRPWRARPLRRGWPAWRRWRTPSWCTPSPRTPPSVRSWSTRRT